MITTEVYGPDKLEPFKSVYYRSHGRTIRKTFIDDNGNIVKDYLYEYDDNQRVECIVQFSQDHVTVAGIENIYYYENSRRRKYTEKFKFENNRKIRTEKAVYEYNDIEETSTITIYRESDEPVGYALFGIREGDEFMSLMGCFDMNNEKMSCHDLTLIPPLK